MRLADIKAVCAVWQGEVLDKAGIAVHEDADPPFSPESEEFRLLYRRVFMPRDPAKASIELRLLEDHVFSPGAVTLEVLIESYGRIAQRLQQRTSHLAFQALTVFRPRSQDQLLTVFDAVTRGRLFLVTQSLWGFMLRGGLYFPKSFWEGAPDLQRTTVQPRSIADNALSLPAPLLGRIDAYKPWRAVGWGVEPPRAAPAPRPVRAARARGSVPPVAG